VAIAAWSFDRAGKLNSLGLAQRPAALALFRNRFTPARSWRMTDGFV
jgi:hypothetical protein